MTFSYFSSFEPETISEPMPRKWQRILSFTKLITTRAIFYILRFHSISTVWYLWKDFTHEFTIVESQCSQVISRVHFNSIPVQKRSRVEQISRSRFPTLLSRATFSIPSILAPRKIDNYADTPDTPFYTSTSTGYFIK